MNRKLIAAAVSAAVIAPVAAQAESSFYGSIRNVISIDDTSAADDAESTTDISTMASRLGFTGNTDLGNGMTAHGKYEFATKTDNDDEGVSGTRIATVGLSGGFGRVDVGNQWSAFYNTVGTFISPTYSLGFYMYTGVGSGLYRTANTIQYSNSFGPVSAYLDVRLDDKQDGQGNGMGLGLSFAVADNITVAAAFDSADGAEADAVAAVPASHDYAAASADYAPAYEQLAADGIATTTVDKVGTAQVGTAAVSAIDATDKPDTDRVGVAVNASLGNFWGSLGFYNYQVDDDESTSTDDEVDIDTIYLWVGGDISEKTSWMVGYSTADDAADAKAAKTGFAAVPATDDSSQITWGIYHKMGGGMRLFYEATSIENANADTPLDGDRHLLGMRVDF